MLIHLFIVLRLEIDLQNYEVVVGNDDCADKISYDRSVIKSAGIGRLSNIERHLPRGRMVVSRQN